MQISTVMQIITQVIRIPCNVFHHRHLHFFLQLHRLLHHHLGRIELCIRHREWIDIHHGKNEVEVDGGMKSNQSDLDRSCYLESHHLIVNENDVDHEHHRHRNHRHIDRRKGWKDMGISMH